MLKIRKVVENGYELILEPRLSSSVEGNDAKLGDPQLVNLAYDRDAKVIAVRNVSGGNDTIFAFDTTKRYNDGSATIRTKEFMSKVIDEMGLDLSGNKILSCPATYNARKKLLVIQVVLVEEVTE